MSTRGLDVTAVRCRLTSERPPRQKVNGRRSTLKIYRSGTLGAARPGLAPHLAIVLLFSGTVLLSSGTGLPSPGPAAAAAAPAQVFPARAAREAILAALAGNGVRDLSRGNF